MCRNVIGSNANGTAIRKSERVQPLVEYDGFRHLLARRISIIDQYEEHRFRRDCQTVEWQKGDSSRGDDSLSLKQRKAIPSTVLELMAKTTCTGSGRATSSTIRVEIQRPASCCCERNSISHDPTHIPNDWNMRASWHRGLFSDWYSDHRPGCSLEIWTFVRGPVRSGHAFGCLLLFA